MKTLRAVLFSSLLAVLTGCPNNDKCSGVMCPSGQSCSADTGMCTVGGNGGGSGGGTGGNGGAGANNGGGDAGPPVMLSELCAKVAQTQCDKLERCGQLAAADKSVCVALQTDNCTLTRGVMAGNSTFDGVAAAHCIADFATTDCADPDAPPSCAAAIVGGRGQNNAPCNTSSQCQADAGLYCRLNDFSPCDFCGPRVGAGQFCAFDVYILCQPGLSCDEDFFDLDGGHCRAPGQLNEDCTIIDCARDAGVFCRFATDGGRDYCNAQLTDGQAPCTSTTQCAGGTFCAYDAGVGNTCATLRATDQPCQGTTWCQPGLYCPPGAAGSRKCTALLADGMACAVSNECVGNYCNRPPQPGVDAGTRRCGYLISNDECWGDTDCGPGKVCNGYIRQRTDAGAVSGACASQDPDGGACRNSSTRFSDSCANLAATCLDGLCVVTPPFSRRLGQTCDSQGQCGNVSRCDFADQVTFEGHCVAPLDDGLECFEDAECKLGSYCDLGGTDTCLAYAKRGEGCDDFNGPYCAAALTCNDADGGGTACGPYVPNGSPCNASSGPQCYGSYCQADAGQCAPRQANGASCTGAGQCSSGRCENPDGGFTDESCLMACF